MNGASDGTAETERSHPNARRHTPTDIETAHEEYDGIEY